MKNSTTKAKAAAGWADDPTSARPAHSTSSSHQGSGAPSAANAFQAGPARRRSSRNGAIVFTITIFVCAAALALLVAYLVAPQVGVLHVAIALAVGLLACNSIHITLEWEKAVILRFGRFNRVAGPGLVFNWPIVEFYTLRVDQRVTATYFGAEETLSADLVPLNVDAVLFWMVWDAKKACIEVEDYSQAVAWIAQTALRKAIGRASVVEVATRRDQLDDELKEIVEDILNPWGITVIDVEIRDIVIPKELQDAMSKEAQAEREKEARMVLAEAEKDISDMLKDASAVYGNDDVAMKLRTMHLAYESVKQSGGTLVLPSAFSEGFADKPKAGE